jgi:valyl-tRNA synthetase
MFRELPKTYEPLEIERHWAQLWAERDWFHASVSDPRPTWALVIPPPNVTGSLHMGHMLEHTQIDAIVRWRRMSGDNTLWLPGKDHAGIATQMVVERELKKQGLDRRDLGREKFVAKVWEWKDQSGDTIKRQMIRIGDSCDWSRERFTLDEGLSRAVREVFVSLYEEGLLYRGRYIVNWCPRCQTAVSDLEVVHRESVGKLYHVRYLFTDSEGGLPVATTRPETILGDAAVAVNPSDERYLAIVGRQVRVPLSGRAVPVIADEIARPEFGSGAVKITPAHDPNDFLAGRRHGLPELVIMDERGVMTDEAGAYRGLDRFAAREKAINDLEAAGLLVKTEDHAMAIGHCQRCNTIIEPRLSMQWFVRVGPLAENAIRVVEDGHVQIQPENYRAIYLQWMYDIHDWCISRQLWWGHRIPAWYCDSCNEIIVSRTDPTECPKCGSALRQDPDVLDTWFSSGLWPFSTLGWPDDTPDLRKFYPTSLLITGFDILFFWVARMIMLGVHFMKRDGRPIERAVPFRSVFIHGLVRDAEKQKMSKTRGNVTDPLALIDRYGTDAVRFTLCAMAAPGTDIVLSETRMEGYQAFANKLWNAARFIFSSLDRLERQGVWNREDSVLVATRRTAQGGPVGEDLVDRWIFSRINAVAGGISESLAAFRFHEAADSLYHFIWHEFCDWYIELVKLRFGSSLERARPARDAADNLLLAFEAVLRLLHPFMPFVTEELWQAMWGEAQSSPLGNGGGAERDSAVRRGAAPYPTIALAPYPRPQPGLRQPEAERQAAAVQEIVTAVRSVRAEWKVPPRSRINMRLAFAEHSPASHGEALEVLRAALQSLAGAAEIEVVAALDGPAVGRIASGHFDVQLDLAGQIDTTAERDRLEKELDTVARSLANARRQLENADFVAKAPAAVIQETRRRLGELTEREARLRSLLSSLAG